MNYAVHISNLYYVFIKGGFDDTPSLLLECQEIHTGWTKSQLDTLGQLFRKLPMAFNHSNETLADGTNMIRRDLGHHLADPDAIPPNELNLSKKQVALLKKLETNMQISISRDMVFNTVPKEEVKRCQEYCIPQLRKS